MGTKLYVGNLSYNTTEEEVRDLFAQAGNVLSVKIITDKFSGRSKGFGFVEMADDESANKAISTLNGTTLNERQLAVDFARPPQEKERKFNFGPRSGGRKNSRKPGFGGR